MTHFVCSECGKESAHSDVCTTSYCLSKGMPLSECTCTSGLHEGVVAGVIAPVAEEDEAKDTTTERPNDTVIDLDNDPDTN